MNLKDSKQKWRNLCEQNADIPVFLQPWWWDITCGKSGWGIALSLSDKGIPRGAMHYQIKKTLGLKRLTLPPFTPFNGIWMRDMGTTKTHSVYSKKRKIVAEIIDQLPNSSLQDFKIHYDMDDWLPFKWKGYRQTTQYTQILDITAEEKAIFDGFKSATRAKIKRASAELKLKDSCDINRFVLFIEQLFQYKKLNIRRGDISLIRELDRHLASLGKRSILGVIDARGEIYAMIYLIYSGKSVHYWLGGANPRYRSHSGMYMLLWEAIKKSRDKAQIFDFDGSNHPKIAPVFTGFGARPQGQHYIYKSSGRLIQILRVLKGKTGG